MTRAGVTLASAATAQLVVHPAGFVALGAEHVETVGRNHLVMAALPIAFDLLALCVIHLSKVGEFHLEVTAEHDIGTAACHVGGNGHGTRLPGLGNDVSLALMVFGVQHLVVDVSLRSRPARYSEVSIEAVPTRTGCWRNWHALISSMIAPNFSSWVR